MSNLNTQTLLGPLSSADRVCLYLLEDEQRHFGESIDEMQPGDEPHIFAHVLNHLLSRGESIRVDAETLAALELLEWLPEAPHHVLNDTEGYFTFKPGEGLGEQ